MFEKDKDLRIEIYDSIYTNLSCNTMTVGLSSLRRIEIRYLPLDPLFISQLFRSL